MMNSGPFQARQSTDLQPVHKDERLQCAWMARSPWPAHASRENNVPEQFENPFTLEDLCVFDEEAWEHILCQNGLSIEQLAESLRGASSKVVERIRQRLPQEQRAAFENVLRNPEPNRNTEAARKEVLDYLFWELTYWLTPDFYDELTEGERLHCGIFEQLEPDIRGGVILDAGAGSGRASFECVKYGAQRVYAVEPSPGLLRILRKKREQQGEYERIVPTQGRFDALPLPDNSVDLTISCSAFTADSKQGGETGLAELKRVTRPGCKIVIIWPRPQDYDWLAEHGFRYVLLPVDGEMAVHFRSLRSAIRCAKRFYAHNGAVLRYIEQHHSPDVPFSVIGFNPPCDYCWLIVE
ncbi:MAG TPA: methyltransferase domain-containing protein [Ktedonobacteraceae bacterium]|nr:methyltransferase domain-containing protein [Ktedonobacteraceae bacterium]